MWCHHLTSRRFIPSSRMTVGKLCGTWESQGDIWKTLMASVRPIPIVMGMLGMKTGSQKSLKIQVDSRNRKRKKERFRDQILPLTKSGELVSFKNKKKKERTEKNDTIRMKRIRSWVVSLQTTHAWWNFLLIRHRKSITQYFKTG